MEQSLLNVTSCLNNIPFGYTRCTCCFFLERFNGLIVSVYRYYGVQTSSGRQRIKVNDCVLCWSHLQPSIIQFLLETGIKVFIFGSCNAKLPSKFRRKRVTDLLMCLNWVTLLINGWKWVVNLCSYHSPDCSELFAISFFRNFLAKFVPNLLLLDIYRSQLSSQYILFV